MKKIELFQKIIENTPNEIQKYLMEGEKEFEQALDIAKSNMILSKIPAIEITYANFLCFIVYKLNKGSPNILNLISAIIPFNQDDKTFSLELLDKAEKIISGNSLVDEADQTRKNIEDLRKSIKQKLTLKEQKMIFVAMKSEFGGGNHW